MSRLLLLLVALLLLLSGCSSLSPAPDRRHIILFIGDGMQLQHEIALSRYLYGTDFDLVWHRFPVAAPAATWDISTYNVHARTLGLPPYRPEAFDPLLGYDPARGGRERHPLTAVEDRPYLLAAATDSAAAATAMATGRKTEKGMVAWSDDPEAPALRTIAEIMRQERGAAVGIVSTVPFSHATPAAFVSHNVHRGNTFTGRNGYPGVGIADEIVRLFRPEVVIGGGHPDWNGTYMSRPLYEEVKASAEYLLVERNTEVDGGAALATAAVEARKNGKKLFGLFGGAKGNFDLAQVANAPGAPAVQKTTSADPTMAQATEAALEVLSADTDGFFLLAEQGEVDWANHDNDYGRMLAAMHDLHQAVQTAVAFVDRPGDDIDWDNTLLLVTSDHGNSLMRLSSVATLGAGALPDEGEVLRAGQLAEPASAPVRVIYGSKSHTNELVSFYAAGRQARLFEGYRGLWYPGTGILDNTQIFQGMAEFLRQLE